MMDRSLLQMPKRPHQLVRCLQRPDISILSGDPMLRTRTGRVPHVGGTSSLSLTALIPSENQPLILDVSLKSRTNHASEYAHELRKLLSIY